MSNMEPDADDEFVMPLVLPPVSEEEVDAEIIPLFPAAKGPRPPVFDDED
jgi:hypothetical protein